MKRKNYLLLTGWLYALVCVVLAVVLVYEGSQLDTFGLAFGIGMLALFAYKSYIAFKDLKTVREEDRAFAPPTDATVQEQIAYFKRIILLGAIAFSALSIWICLDLNSLESAEAETVRIWGPVAFLYEMGGYWVAILTVPLLGILVLGSLLKKIADLQKQTG